MDWTWSSALAVGVVLAKAYLLLCLASFPVLLILLAKAPRVEQWGLNSR